VRKFFYSLTHRLLTDNISFLAGGVAFYGLLALFPAMGALVALMALAANPQVVQEQLQEVRFLFPPEVYTLLHDQILSLVKQSNDTLGLTFFISVFLALLSANRGTKGLLAALNMIFRVRENRIWWRQQLVSLGITFGGLSMAMVCISHDCGHADCYQFHAISIIGRHALPAAGAALGDSGRRHVRRDFASLFARPQYPAL
jgi:membrane protein